MCSGGRGRSPRRPAAWQAGGMAVPSCPASPQSSRAAAQLTIQPPPALSPGCTFSRSQPHTTSVLRLTLGLLAQNPPASSLGAFFLVVKPFWQPVGSFYGFIQGRGPGSHFLNFSAPGIKVFRKHLFVGCLKWRCLKFLQQPNWGPWSSDLDLEVHTGDCGLTLVALVTHTATYSPLWRI